MSIALAFLIRLGRTILLILLVTLGTIALMRFAPGYFADAREMDARYAQQVREQLAIERSGQASALAMASNSLKGIVRGEFGQSRQYGVSVRELINARIGTTASLLLRAIAIGWILAFSIALPTSAGTRGSSFATAAFTLLIAIPTGAMATLCLLADEGGPVLVLSLLLAARDFKFLHRQLQRAWRAPHVLQARAQGLTSIRLAAIHVLPNLLPQFLALASLSLVTALSALVPVEVIFDVPGLGQLAWSAAINRDLPVLLGVIILMAVAVAAAGIVPQRVRLVETA